MESLTDISLNSKFSVTTQKNHGALVSWFGQATKAFFAQLSGMDG